MVEALGRKWPTPSSTERSGKQRSPGAVLCHEGWRNQDRELHQLYDLWAHNGALAIDGLEATCETFNFNVTRCEYAETYNEMGLGHIGHLMPCNRAGTFCQGYNPNIKLVCEHTIMDGSHCCTFPVFLSATR
jgi:hypothetical protein